MATLYYLDNAQPLFVKYKCLKFVDIVKLKTLIVVFRAIKRGELPVNLHKLFIETREIHKYNTRSSTRGNLMLNIVKLKCDPCLLV